MKNKIIAALLTLSILLSQCIIIPAFAVSDYEEHWAKEHIDKLIAAGIVAGDENGEINPDNSILRSEFVKIVNRKFNFNNAGTENFPDVSANAWYANEFKIAKAQGYLAGDDKGNANPDNPITRAEVSVIIARVLKLNDNYSSVTLFSDDDDIPSWAKDSVYRLNLKGYINGYPDGSFKAQNTITRAESFTIIAKITTTAAISNVPSSGGFGGGSSGGGGGSSSSGSSGGGGGGGSSSGGTSGGSTEKEPENKDRTPEELKKLNDNKEPEIESREDSDIGLYSGIYSDVKVDDVEGAIASLENVKTLFNIGDVEEEFVPFDDDGSTIDENTYKIQQVYNGVPVANAQTIITVNEEGYPDSILNRYDDSVRLSGINTTPSISEAKAKEIILADLIAKNTEYTNGNVKNIYLEIQAEQEILTYHAYVTCDNSSGFNYYVDAHSGEVVAANEITPDFAYNPSGVSNPAKMWGLSTDIFYDTALQKYVFYNDKKKITVYDMQNANGDPIYFDKLPIADDGSRKKYDNIIAVLPDNEQTQLSNGQPLNPSDHLVVDGFYAIYNFDKTTDVYSSIAYIPSVDVSINLNWSNAVARGGDDSDKFKTAYGNCNGNPGIRQLDTVAHEFTHFYQNYYVNSFHLGNRMSESLGDGFKTKNSSNMSWVEAKAISEGTADIMGMLVEAISGECLFDSEDFWVFGESQGEKPQEDNAANNNLKLIKDKIYTDKIHITVDDMRDYYNGEKDATYSYVVEAPIIGAPVWKEKTVKSNQLEYPYGPGHADRYILINAFIEMVSKVSNLSQTERDVLKANNDDAEVWFKLWGNAIKKLTPSSDFADMRLALLQTANDMNFSQKEYNAVAEGLRSAGITATHNADTKSIWYRPYVNAAYADISTYTGNIVITKTQADNAHLYLSRGELLKMVIDRCDIKVTHLNNESYYTNKRYGQYVQLAYNYGAVNMQWLKSAAQEPDDSNSFLNQNIPRWEAMHIMYKLMNASEVHHAKTRTYGYHLSGDSEWNYAKFKNTFEDFGECVPDTDRDNMVNLLNMLRGYLEMNENGNLNLSPTSEIDEFKRDENGNLIFDNNRNPIKIDQSEWNKKVYGKDGGLEKFLTEHHALDDKDVDKNYMSTNTCSKYTYSMLYYFGMYQLWVNGKFSGQSVDGVKMLKATDPITIGEACAIMYK